MNQMEEKIRQLKKEKDAVILAHYYAPDEVQRVADYIGDSYYLAKLATEIPQKTIVFCGVEFMGESAKALNPQKRVLMPDLEADCPMAHMADEEKVRKVREKYPDAAVVCYVNSTAQLKACSDVCVTSSNALKIVKALPNEKIYFIPDENLGRHIAKLVPEKEFIFNDGFCHIHATASAAEVQVEKEAHPEALVLAHPECRPDLLELADYIGSTSGIIDFATDSQKQEFIICTEEGVLFELKKRNPGKTFYTPRTPMRCENMKKNTLEKIVSVLETGDHEVLLEEELRTKANEPLARMLALAK